MKYAVCVKLCHNDFTKYRLSTEIASLWPHVRTNLMKNVQSRQARKL